MPDAKEDSKRSKWGGVLIGALITSILAVFLARLFFGVELTDETYYVTMAARFALGNLPFHDNWDMHQTSALLYAPIVMAYKNINGDFSGIMLFMRLMMFVFSLSISVMIYQLLKKQLGLKSLIIALPMVVLAPYSIYNFSYNTLHYLLATAGCVLVFAAINSNGPKRIVFLSMAGAAHALTVFAYPSALGLFGINSLVVFLLFHSEDRKSTKAGSKAVLIYVISGCALSACIAGPLLLNLGLDNFQNGLNGLLSSSEEFYKLLTPHIRLIKVSQLLLSPINPFFVQKIIVLGIWNALLFQQFKEEKTYFLLLLAGGYVLLVLYFASCVYASAATGGDVYILSEFTAFSAMLAPVLVLYTKHNKRLFKLLLIVIGIPALVVWLESFWISMAKLSTSAYLLFALSMLSPVFIVLLIEEYWKPINVPFNLRKSFRLNLNTDIASKFCTTIFIAAISGLFLFAFYGHVFRDGAIWTLTKRVESGVYRGLYTQPGRARTIELLESELKKFDDPSKTVLVLDHFPLAYMSTGMKPCTPYSLDVSLSRFNMNLSGPVFRYFKHTKQIPDIIFCIGEEGKACLETPDSKLAGFIRNNYAEVFQNNSELYLRVLGKR